MTNPVSIDSLESKIVRFQPSAHALEQPLVGANIYDNVDVLGCPYRLHAILTS
jgi:hypothetical protein